MKFTTFLLLLTFLLFGCQKSEEKKTSITEIPTASKNGGEPNLFVSETDQIYLSWIEYLNDSTNALRFSILEKEEWSAPKTVATGSNWFVNWADFPSLCSYKDNGKSLAAHWLQKSAAGTYDYDVKISQSFDGGLSWTPPFTPHQDGIPAEHGFVSLLPLSHDNIFATWLDGRNTKGHGHGEGGHHHHGSMTLRAAVFNKNEAFFQYLEPEIIILKS